MSGDEQPREKCRVVGRRDGKGNRTQKPANQAVMISRQKLVKWLLLGVWSFFNADIPLLCI